MVRLYPYCTVIRRHMSKIMLSDGDASCGPAVKLSYQKYEPESSDSGRDALARSTPIFILHGLLGSKTEWANFGKSLSTMTKRSVVTVDLRNHGGSEHAKSNKYPDQAQDMMRLFRQLSVTRASIVGHNMGARACMCLALAHPQTVASLLVFDMSPVSTCQDFMTMYPVVLRAMLAVDFSRETQLSKACVFAKEQMKPFVSDDYLMESVLANVQIIGNTHIAWRCDTQVLLDEFQHIASFPKYLRNPYMGPTLFIGGQLSEYLPPDDLTKIRERFPNAVVIYVPGTTHHLHVEAPTSVMELSIKFLKRNS